MKNVHLLGGIVLAFVISVPMAYGQTQAGYRNFELGGTLSSVSAAAKADAGEAKTIHARPALIQELGWRTPYSAQGAGSDPVQQILFSFYNDQLSRIAIDYDRSRTAGMTDADMIERISATYGTLLKPLAPKAAATARSGDVGDGTSIARWGDADQTVVLYRSDFFGGSTARYLLVVTSPRLDALARTASAQAVRMDDREAPQREAAQQKKDAADARAADEKARATNKAAFRP